MSELWEKRFDRNALAILNTSIVYYQRPTFPQLHRTDFHDNKKYLTQFDVTKKTQTNKGMLDDIKEADEYATGKIKL